MAQNVAGKTNEDPSRMQKEPLGDENRLIRTGRCIKEKLQHIEQYLLLTTIY